MDSNEINAPSWLRSEENRLILSIKLQPRASRNSVESAVENELRIKVTAPPVDSAANEALVCFLSKRLDVPRNRIELMRGHTSRHKQIAIYGISARDLLSKLGG